MNRDDLTLLCLDAEGTLMYLGMNFSQDKAMELAEKNPDTIYFFIDIVPTTDIWED